MKYRPHKILGGKAAQNVQIDPETTEIWPEFKTSTLPMNTGMCHETIRNGVLINSGWQSRIERPNRSTNNGYMAKTAKRGVVCE